MLPCPADAILGNGSGIDYERQRYARALAATTTTTSSGSGAGAGQESSSDGGVEAALEAAPLTAAWMRQVVAEVSAVLRCAVLHCLCKVIASPAFCCL